jgi:hypothetical protein
LIDYDKIGIEHNKGLEMLFIQLKKVYPKNRNIQYDQNDLIDFIKSSSIEFTQKNHPELSEIAIKDLIQNVDRMKLYFSKNLNSARLTNINNVHENIVSDVEHLLTLRQKQFVDEIMLAITSGGSELSVIVNKLNEIEQRVRGEAAIDELPVLLTSISVAKHSMQYWYHNFSKWETEFGVSIFNGKVQREVNWWGVGAADVAAAVSVGTVTSTALLVPFIGWGAWGIITGGATVVVSGFTAALQAYCPCR